MDGCADEIVRKLLDQKDEIEKSLHGCEVILSLPIRSSKVKGNKSIQTFNAKMYSLVLRIINSNNIQTVIWDVVDQT